jgi:hypothetical protein
MILENIGSKTASVFPVPVGAISSMFSPAMMRGIAIFWDRVGSVNPNSFKELRIGFASRLKAATFGSFLAILEA